MPGNVSRLINQFSQPSNANPPPVPKRNIPKGRLVLPPLPSESQQTPPRPIQTRRAVRPLPPPKPGAARIPSPAQSPKAPVTSTKVDRGPPPPLPPRPVKHTPSPQPQARPIPPPRTNRSPLTRPTTSEAPRSRPLPAIPQTSQKPRLSPEEAIMRRFTVGPDGALVSKKYKTSIGLTEDKLKKLINMSIENLSDTEPGTTASVTLRDVKGKKMPLIIQLKTNKRGEQRVNIIEKSPDKKLGSGGLGEILKAKSIHTGKKLVAKQRHFGIEDEADVKALNRILKKEKKFISKLYDSINQLAKQDPEVKLVLQKFSPGFLPIIKPYAINAEDDKTSHVVLERGKGDAYKKIKSDDFKANVRLVKDLFVALYLMEKAGAYHFDIKPENLVLFEHKGELRGKVVDFGASRFAFTQDEINAGTLRGGKPILMDVLTNSFTPLYTDMSKYHLQTVKYGDSADNVNKRLQIFDRVSASRVMAELLGVGSTDSNKFVLTADESHPEFVEIFDRLNGNGSPISLIEVLEVLDKFEKRGEVT